MTEFSRNLRIFDILTQGSHDPDVVMLRSAAQTATQLIFAHLGAIQTRVAASTGDEAAVDLAQAPAPQSEAEWMAWYHQVTSAIKTAPGGAAGLLNTGNTISGLMQLLTSVQAYQSKSDLILPIIQTLQNQFDLSFTTIGDVLLGDATAGDLTRMRQNLNSLGSILAALGPVVDLAQAELDKINIQGLGPADVRSWYQELLSIHAELSAWQTLLSS